MQLKCQSDSFIYIYISLSLSEEGFIMETYCSLVGGVRIEVEKTICHMMQLLYFPTCQMRVSSKEV